ncbi:hypothetical protein FA13DRAFT_1010781 [Coprinellus micaceus]|uniref:Uncharacterized protein n=1 Tax=Coprinellus micaceus TaxID=71717 RepID=A0A4Y7SZU4_COPMI|nr:hypothetical protein FA13DRAFT_1010781 [Coprinellus micaceus]
MEHLRWKWARRQGTASRGTPIVVYRGPNPRADECKPLRSCAGIQQLRAPVPVCAIVDWTKANGRTKVEGLERRCIGFSNQIEIVRLIPGNRVLVIYDGSDYNLFNWELDCLPTTEASHEAIDHGLTSPLPVWRFETRESTLHLAISHPLIIGSSIRMPLPTRHGLFILTVPLNDHTRNAVHSDRAVKSRLREGTFCHIAHFQKAVGLRGENDYKKIYYADYPWTAGESTPDSTFHVVDYPFDDLGTEYPGNLLFDQYSNRVVVSDHDGTRFSTVLPLAFNGPPAPASAKQAAVLIAEESENLSSEEGAGTAKPPIKDDLAAVVGTEGKGVEEGGLSAEVGVEREVSTIVGGAVDPASQGDQPTVEENYKSSAGDPLNNARDEGSDSIWTGDSFDGGSGGCSLGQSSGETSEISLEEGSGGLPEVEDSGEAPIANSQDSAAFPAERGDASGESRKLGEEDDAPQPATAGGAARTDGPTVACDGPPNEVE